MMTSPQIEKLFDEGKKIDKRKKKAYNEWKEKINFLIDMYNVRSKFKTYNKVKSLSFSINLFIIIQ